MYANGVTVKHVDGFSVEFFGSEGEVKVGRGKFVFKHGDRVVSQFRDKDKDKGTSCAAQVAIAEKQFLANAKVKLYRSTSHPDDFLARVADRKPPITSEVVGARSAICCHLMNLTYYHGQKLSWDPARLRFTGKTGETAWLTRDYRKPWRV